MGIKPITCSSVRAIRCLLTYWLHTRCFYFTAACFIQDNVLKQTLREPYNLIQLRLNYLSCSTLRLSAKLDQVGLST